MLRIQDMIVTTTPSIDGREIQNYLGTVSSHVVAGTSVFSDIFASFRDIFGGRSRSYQKQLSAIDTETIRLLKEKALLLGANAIIGLRVDHDEISGGGKSMFMVTACATAVYTVKIVSQSNDSKNSTKIHNIMSLDDIKIEIKKRDAIKLAEEGTLTIDDELWDFIIENKIEGLASFILTSLRRYCDSNYHYENNEGEIFLEKSIEYFNGLPEDISKKKIYGFINEKYNQFLTGYNLIDRLNLLDCDYIEKMLDSGDFSIQKRALKLLELNKSIYTQDDVSSFNKILFKIESIFKMKGKYIDTTEGGLSSSGVKEKWECECERVMAAEIQYCTNCGQDIFGFKKGDFEPKDAANAVSEKIMLLENYFNEKV